MVQVWPYCHRKQKSECNDNVRVVVQFHSQSARFAPNYQSWLCKAHSCAVYAVFCTVFTGRRGIEIEVLVITSLEPLKLCENSFLFM